ncbi:hypothetical protein COV82_04190 [Candidatus Peregrinibacteria bacterium CG11_big_fil_rev_8_21_14_0_20_46_8]|nr:MAG: hypothetical protein COV82_04190 [Candidatus Peregrinibacteria bacterium CG11_big_fil_rev_8_21_14_0_20_46_8]
MKIYVTAKPGAKENKVEPLLDPHHVKVWVKEPPTEGKANLAIMRELAAHFHVKKSAIEQTHGFKSKQKIFTIEGL